METAAPLSDPTRKTAAKEVRWNAECEKKVEKLESLLSEVRKCPHFEKAFVLQTDASDRGGGGIIQWCKLLLREGKYSVVEKECLVIRLVVQMFKGYLLGRPFTIQTDHRSLEWLDRLKDSNNRLMRWSLALQLFQSTVQYRTKKGKCIYLVQSVWCWSDMCVAGAVS